MLTQGPGMAANKYPTAFPLKHQRKDLELALKYAAAQSQDLPVAAASTELFKKVGI
jgi:glyoxylate/succinic semialdehyde reductase